MSYGTSYDHMMRTSSFSLNNMVLHPLYPNEDCVGTDLTWHEDPRTLLQGGQRQIFTGSSWQQQSNFPQHFDDENKQSAMYSPALSLALHSSSRPGMDAVSSVPQVAGPRMVSPVPSYDISTPTSSNARSPATDSEYPESYGTPQIHDDLLFPNDISYSNTDFGSACAGRPPLPLFAQPAGYPCVNLSDVQAWSDPQDLLDPPEDVFMSPKGYLDMGQTEYSIEVDTQTSKGADARAAYRPSPATHPQLRTPNNVGYAQAEDQFEAATDVDADIEEEDEIIEEEASDTDYKPKATRATKRRRNNSFKPSSSSTRGRGRVTKPKRARATKATKMQETVQCKTCKALFDNSDLLKRHVEDSHPRSFTCVFNFAGCDSTFGSKNEWKRHVSTQHLVFNTWTCNIDQCGIAHDPTPSAEKNASGGQASKGGSFNRKDLFTQHLRRMHSPTISKKQTNQKAKWEEKVKALQQSCMRLNRSPPKALNCPVADCEAVFGGPKCWDDHMEHVAKHLENAANITGAPSVHHEDDQSLVSWALTEGVIELVNGVFKLIPTETYFERLEQDAEGESEY